MRWIWWTATDCWMVQGEWYRGSADVSICGLCAVFTITLLSEAIRPFAIGAVWGSSCSIWWQNTNLKNFIRENSEIRLTYYFYWLWSFKVYNNTCVNDLHLNVWKTRFLLSLSWYPFLLNFHSWYLRVGCTKFVHSNGYNESQHYVLLIPKMFLFSDYLRKLEGNYLEFTTFGMLLMLIL